MKISIITVCYNEAETVEKTLLSIFSQTYKNIESIVIDGASTDGTQDIIGKYRDKIAYFISEPDEGIYNAMNKGIKAATGDILYFLNANDYLYSDDVLETVVNTFNESNYDLVYGDICLLYPDKPSVIRSQDINPRENLFLTRILWHQASFYKKSLFDKFGLYNEDFKIAGDHDFNMKILTNKKVKIRYVKKIIANFTLTGISASKKFLSLRENEKRLIFYRYAFSSPLTKFFYYTKCLIKNPEVIFNPAKLLRIKNEIDYLM